MYCLSSHIFVWAVDSSTWPWTKLWLKYMQGLVSKANKKQIMAVSHVLTLDEMFGRINSEM